MLVVEKTRQKAAADSMTRREAATATKMHAPRTTPLADSTPELVQILDQYLADLHEGRQPDRDRLFADHPELAEQLKDCLAGLDFLHRAPQDATVPDRLGDFRIVREVGRGGMGVVYEAEQVSLKRRVALKVLRFSGSGGDAMQRFRREAETVATLHHTNIVPIFAIGCEGDVPYYAMQFIEGRSLADVGEDSAGAGNPVPPRDLAHLALQASEALDHAHRRGVVHRDVKPSNLILDFDGRIWLTDFGLAKRADDVTLSVAGALLGTPRYMSPEQASAMSSPVDHRTDVYSLGATLYELATGRPIFHADSPHVVISQILHAQPPRPRSIAPGLPRDLETIILKCLAKDPRDRYQSAGELAGDLRAFLDERPIAARRATWLERARRWSRRNPLAAGLAAALVTALVGGLIGVTSLWAMAEDRREEAEANAQAAERERDTAEDRLWKSLYEQARAERLAGHRWRSLELVAEAGRHKITSGLRQEAIQAITSPGVRRVATLGPQDVIYGGEAPRVAFSSDGTWVAAPTRSAPTESEGEASGVKVWEVASGRLVNQTTCIERPGSFAFSPAGPLMAVAAVDETIRLWDPASGQVVSSFPGRHPLRFSPGGTLLAVRGPEGIELREVPNGHVYRQLPSGMPLRFLADDMLLVRNGSRVDVWNVETGEIISSSPDEWSAIWSVELGDIAGDGPLVALRRGAPHGLQEGPVSIWNALTNKTIAKPANVGRVPYAAALPLSAELELFAFPDPKQPYAVQLFDLRLGAFRRPLLAPSSSDRPLLFGRFNPNGTVLVAQEGGLNTGVRLWSVETGESLAYLHDQVNPVWSPDGRYLAVTGPGRFRLPDGVTQSGSRAALLVYEVAPPNPTSTVTSRPSAIAFDATGEKLAVQGSRFKIVEKGLLRRLRPITSDVGDDGKFVATGGGIWRFRSYPYVEPSEGIHIEQVFPEHRELLLAGVERAEAGSVQSVAVSPNGGLLLLEWQRRVPIEDRPSAHRLVHQLELWDLASQSRISVWEPRPRRMVRWGVLRFNRDGQLAVTTEGGFIFIRDVPTGEMVGEARVTTDLVSRPGYTHTKVHTIADAAFAADGRFLVCGGQGGRIGVIDVATGQILSTWDGHDGNVTALAVSPNSHLVASCGEDKLLRLWELGTGHELARWEPHQNSTTAIQFSPDGRSLATACGDGTIRLWDLPEIRKQLAAVDLDW